MTLNESSSHGHVPCRRLDHSRPGIHRALEAWLWSGLAAWRMTPAAVEREKKPVVADWPVDRPQRWVQLVNQPQTPAEEEALRRAIQRGRPFGGATWEKQAATRLG